MATDMARGRVCPNDVGRELDFEDCGRALVCKPDSVGLLLPRAETKGDAPDGELDGTGGGVGTDAAPTGKACCGRDREDARGEGNDANEGSGEDDNAETEGLVVADVGEGTVTVRGLALRITSCAFDMT